MSFFAEIVNGYISLPPKNVRIKRQMHVSFTFFVCLENVLKCGWDWLKERKITRNTYVGFVKKNQVEFAY